MSKLNAFLSRLIIVTLIGGGICFSYMTHKKQQFLEAQLCEWQKNNKELSDELPESVKFSTVCEKCNRSWASLQKELQNTVVQIIVQYARFDWLQPYMTPTQGAVSGSGFFIDKDGYFLTNAHVIEQAKAISVQIPVFGKERFDAEIIGVSFDRDVALLKLGSEGIERLREKLGKVPYLKLGDSDSVQRGEEIMTLGFPLGHEFLKSTVGIVSGPQCYGPRLYIQIDAPINPGSSGGPSIDSDGRVIGINNSGIAEAQNTGYSIPINELKVVLDGLYKLETLECKILRKPSLGIFYNSSSPALSSYLGNPPGGIYIVELFKGSIIDQAGVKKGDVLYEFDGKKIDCFGEIRVPWFEDKMSIEGYTYYLKYGQELPFVYYRDGERKEGTLAFKNTDLPAVRTKYPDYEPIEYEVIGGMVVMELAKNHIPIMLNGAPQLILYGEAKKQLDPVLVITHIIPDSVAQRCRVLAPGFRLKEINGTKVKSLDDLRKAVRDGARAKFMKVRTYDGLVAAFPVEQMLYDDMRLSNIYHYPVSKTIQEIMMIKKYEKENKARSLSPIKIPALK